MFFNGSCSADSSSDDEDLELCSEGGKGPSAPPYSKKINKYLIPGFLLKNGLYLEAAGHEGNNLLQEEKNKPVRVTEASSSLATKSCFVT